MQSCTRQRPSTSASAATTMAAAVRTAAMEAAAGGVTEAVMEVVIVESAIKISADKAVDADAPVVGPPIVPVRMVPDGIVVVRYGHDTTRCARLGSSGSVRSNCVVWGARWRRRRASRNFSGRGGVRRRRGGDGGRRRARYELVAVCRDRLIRASRELSRGNRRNRRNQKTMNAHKHLPRHARVLADRVIWRAGTARANHACIAKNGRS